MILFQIVTAKLPGSEENRNRTSILKANPRQRASIAHRASNARSLLLDPIANFLRLGSLLSEGGRLVSLMSSPEIYRHEWASFTTKDFPEHPSAKTGDRVKIIMTDVEDRRPVEDVIWYDEDFRMVFQEVDLEVEQVYWPLAREDEPFPWVNETRIPPWTIYVLKRKDWKAGHKRFK